MITLPFVILLILLALKFNKFIRKHNVTLYILFTLLSIISYFMIKIPIFMPIRQGFLGLAFFYVVMLTGALKDKSKYRVALMSVRREYSIIGFIVITPHALFHILRVINSSIAPPWFGIVAYAIMIPLFITSFMKIRKRFTYKSWKSLQRFAYLSYLGLLIHLIINSSKNINTIIYISLFSVYIILKAIYTYRKTLKS